MVLYFFLWGRKWKSSICNSLFLLLLSFLKDDKTWKKKAGYLKHLFMQMSRCGSWIICHAICDASRAVMRRCKRKKQAKHIDTYMRTITASFSRLTVRSIEAQSCTGSGWYLSGHANQNWSGSSASPLFSALIIGMSFQYADFIISQPDLHEKLLYATWLLDCYCWDHQYDGIAVGLERLSCVFIKTFNKTVVC